MTSRWPGGVSVYVRGHIRSSSRALFFPHGTLPSVRSVAPFVILSRRSLVSLAGVLEKADNVLPCYDVVRRQLGAQVSDEPYRNELSQNFAHRVSWSWQGKEMAKEAEGRSKKVAKNEAARSILKHLLAEEAELMDPTRNPALAEWAIQWLNRHLQATMEVHEESPGAPIEIDESDMNSQEEQSHICHWSCPQLAGETVVRGSASSAAECRRQLMAALYQELPSSLDTVIRELQVKDSPRRGGPPPDEAKFGKINVIHNEVVQQLAIRTQYTYTKSGNSFDCKLTWFFYDEAQMAHRTEEVSAEGRTKAVAKGKTHEQMLIKHGHIPCLDDDFHREANAIKQVLDDGSIENAVSQAVALMQRTASVAPSWILFLPDVLRAVLAENNSDCLSLIVSALQAEVGEVGIPLELWEALLDEASFSMRHYYLARSALEQLAGVSLPDSAFPGDMEKEYFKKFRYLLALERHGGLIHGIKQYELDPHMYCSVPLVDVHSIESDKVVLTSIPEAGSQNIVEGSRPLKGSDVVLLVPTEAVGDLRSSDAFEDSFDRFANWQHPEAWIASVTNVKGSPRLGEEVRVYTRQISRFSSDARASLDGSQLSSPIVPGRQYRVFYVAMETPTARMLSALRCLCQVKLPAWSDGFEGRRPSYQYDQHVRRIVLGTSEVALAESSEAPRFARGSASSEEVMQNLMFNKPHFAALAPSQRIAVQRALDERLSVIQGPPGTGKTHVGCAVIAAWVEKYGITGERILAVADSNVAVDNLYARLEMFGIEAVRVGQGKELGSTRVGDELWRAVKNAQVVIATCIGSGMEVLESRGSAKHFQRVLVDECTQACETAALVALGRSCEQIVLIGDHNQLPATVLSMEARDQGLGISLFERMVMTNGLSPTLLVEQRRMHSSIAEFPNKTFYNSQLQNAVDDASLAPIPGFHWPNPDCRVCFVDVSESSEQKRGYSTFNSAEAEAVADVIANLLAAGFPPHEFCILTPYVAQRDEIRRAIGNRNLWHAQASISIDTVDGYQGMERDLVIFSAARSNAEHKLGFMADARRMNVMLTRARRGLIVLGHGGVLRHSPDLGSHWRAWLEWVESKNAVVSAKDLNSHVPRTSHFPGTREPHMFENDDRQMPSNHLRHESTSVDSSSRKPIGEGDLLNSASHASVGIDAAGVSANSAPLPPPPPELKAEWEKVYSEQYSRHYYWNKTTNQTQWEVPNGFV